jgi:hypothetical protein
MSIIPLDVQRRCERRWAARFSRPTESAPLQNQRLEKDEQIAGPDTSKTNARQIESPASLPLSKI